MFSFRKTTFLLAAAALIFCLFACSDGPGEEIKTEVTTASEERITLASGGVTAYAVVRGDNASNAVVSAAAGLRKKLEASTGIKFRLYDEYMFSVSPEDQAIIVGRLGAKNALFGTAEELAGGLLYDDYVIAMRDGTLFIEGGSDKACAAAVEWFAQNCLTDGMTELSLASDFTARYRSSYPLEGLRISGSDPAEYSIVYKNGSYYSEQAAVRLRDILLKYTGRSLSIITDSKPQAAREIVIGNTRRTPDKTVTGDRYELLRTETGLLIEAGGPMAYEVALDSLESTLEAAVKSGTAPDLSGLKLSGSAADKDSKRMILRSEGTDIRVMQSNVLISSTVNTDERRAELLADTYLTYAPDVITLNEYLYNRGITKALAPLVAGEYETVEHAYRAINPDPAEPDDNLKNRRCGFPVLYRKNSGITLVGSGFSYLSDMISYHGYAWAVFDKNGKRFCVFSVHFSDNRDASGQWRTVFSEEVYKETEYVKSIYGDIPFILSGDWYFWKGVSPYNYFTSRGFFDCSQSETGNFSTAIGTFHTVGEGSTGGVIEDLIFITKNSLTVKGYKVPVNRYTVNASDHYPVVADIAFN